MESSYGSFDRRRNGINVTRANQTNQGEIDLRHLSICSQYEFFVIIINFVLEKEKTARKDCGVVEVQRR